MLQPRPTAYYTERSAHFLARVAAELAAGAAGNASLLVVIVIIKMPGYLGWVFLWVSPFARRPAKCYNAATLAGLKTTVPKVLDSAAIATVQ